MDLRFVWVGRTRSPAYKDLEGDYLRRIRRFCPAHLVAIREAQKTDPRQVGRALQREGLRLQKATASSSRVICLEEKGRLFSSRGFARWLAGLQESGCGEMAFVVGGHHGLDPETIARAHVLLSLGKMTLPHELARVVLLEQVYRAFCILNRIPYHRTS